MVHYDWTRSDHHRDAVIGFILTKDPHLLFIALTAWTSLLGLFGNFINPDPVCSNLQLGKLSRLQEKSLPIKADNAF